MLSFRGSENVRELAKPWRFSLTQTYDPVENSTGLISFGMAENKPMRAEIAKYINEKVVFTQDSISYRSSAPTAARLPAAAAVHLNNILKPHAPIDPEDIFVADSPTSLGSMLGYSLAEPEDGILVSRPVYGRFELDYGVESGVKMVYADTTVEEAFSPASVEKYELAFKAAKERGMKIRAVLLVNPHNPVGRCYPVETLKAIARFCNRHSLHLISDEVYASCVFDSGDPEAVPFTSILSLDLTGLIDPNLVHVLYGFSKDFASGGLHLGFLVTQNQQLRQACKAILRLHGASQAAVTIGTAILEDQAFVSSFTAKARQRLASAYQLTTSVLNKEGINYVKGGNAGFFVYIDLSPYLPPGAAISPQNREFALAQRLVDAGVFLHPGEEHSRDIGWFRLVFSQEEETLKEGLNRLLSVLKSSA
ncbi:Pyridoxal phosphate-dependent transferase major region subdomain 2 [Penicillium samsonianum]|uniref:Pyridoxal phosphate-dependent transferase major region subdomain 2 n=1 Tax=Penicillium samsonianum TaxID=1882272 RepID=UPI00254811E7|nr:Pyridoxal phosphate-dependent transferase major region subdomain 2 [Penicillium samsonianum]KAJ6149097.1 Pyridoxal phosphate-dependent transferase major region subdomain 2 [Penicillium samsonianum]